MPTRSLNVVVTGDSRGLNKVLDQTESRTKKWGGVMAKGFAAVGAAAGAGMAVGLKKAADAAIEAEKAQATMVAQLRASGISYRAHAKQIDEVIQKHSNLSGLDDEDLQRSFTNIIRVTGDVDKSLRLTGLAADFARAKHMDVAKAGELIGKVAGGNIGILSRYGITLKDGATSAEALATLQQKFAGQAEAYGKTTAGALDRAGVASENLGEMVGAKLTPILAKGAHALVNLIDASGELAGPIRTASGVVRRAYDSIGDAVRRFTNRNREEIDTAIKAMRNLARAGRFVFEEVLLPVIRTTIRRIVPVLEGLRDTLSGLVRFVTNLLTGQWGKAWDAAKDTVRGAFKTIKSIIVGMGDVLFTLVKSLGGVIVKGIVAGLKGLAKAVKDAVVSGVKGGLSGAKNAVIDAAKSAGSWIIPGAGDGIGKDIVASGMVLPTGPFGGSLKGANPALGPFAALGSRFNLGVSSGRFGRESSITSSGNVSYHSTGEAVDIAGPVPNMLRFAREVAAKYGGRLAELIHTPLGFGIKNGVRVAPYATKDHYDHVHVALDLGRPGVGIGDGVGREQLEIIEAAAKRAGIAPKILYGVYGAESNFGQNLGPSSAGATGPFQFMPATAQSLGVNPNDFRSAAFGAARYLAQYKSRGVRGMLAAYNAGPAGNPNNPETQAYIPKVLSYAGQWPGAGGTGSKSGSGVDTKTKAAGGGGPKNSLGSVVSGGGGIGLGFPAGSGTVADFEQGLAQVDVSKARAERADSLPRMIKALQQERQIKRRRLNKVKKALRRRRRLGKALGPLLTEQAQLIRDISELNSLLKEYKADQRGGATTITGAEELEAGVGADAGGDAGGGDAAEAGPTQEDYANAAVAEASLTTGTADDIQAADWLLNLAAGELFQARASGDPRRISEAISSYQAAKAALDQLKGTVDDSNRLAQERLDLDKQIVANQQAILKLANQGPQIVAAVIAAVNGGIGGQVGLGLQSPGFAGANYHTAGRL